MKSLVVVLCLASIGAWGQSLGNAGTLQGSVTDPSGAVVPNARVIVKNPLTNFQQETMSDAMGIFAFRICR